jgi:hypothetical protein
MTTKKIPSVEALRAATDTAVAAWRELAADEQAQRAAFTEYAAANPIPSDTYTAGRRTARATPAMLEFASRELVVAEACERAAVAEREAVLALDASELAAGDEVATSRDLPSLRRDLVEINIEIGAAEAALVAVRRRAQARVQEAQQAELSLSARRRAADLPYAGSSLSLDPARSPLANVDDALARGIPMPGSVGAANLRAEVRNLATELEEQRIEKEEAEKEAERLRVSKAADVRRQQDAEHKERADRQEAADAEARRREALANAYLARRAGGAAR